MTTMKWAAALVLGLASPIASRAQAPQHQVPANLHCPGDKIVWVNARPGVYHFRGERYFGSTINGKFICDREGDRPTRNGQ